MKDTTKRKVTTKKLKKGRSYQFKVRAYTKISGVRVYGPYSKVTTVKCK